MIAAATMATNQLCSLKSPDCFLDCVLDISPQRAVNGSPRRRCTVGRITSNSAHGGLFHSSMPLLSSSSPRKRKNSVGCDKSSCDKIEMNCSVVYETAVEALLKEVDEAIQMQTNRQEFLEEVIASNVEMAKARYTAGGCEMGAVLSMRKVHKDTSYKAHVSAARFRLLALRQELQNALKAEPCDMVNLDAQRQVFRGTLADLTMTTTPTTTSTPMPPNDELLHELETIMATQEE